MNKLFLRFWLHIKHKSVPVVLTVCFWSLSSSPAAKISNTFDMTKSLCSNSSTTNSLYSNLWGKERAVHLGGLRWHWLWSGPSARAFLPSLHWWYARTMKHPPWRIRRMWYAWFSSVAEMREREGRAGTIVFDVRQNTWHSCRTLQRRKTKWTRGMHCL